MDIEGWALTERGESALSWQRSREGSGWLSEFVDVLASVDSTGGVKDISDKEVSAFNWLHSHSYIREDRL